LSKSFSSAILRFSAIILFLANLFLFASLETRRMFCRTSLRIPESRLAIDRFRRILLTKGLKDKAVAELLPEFILITRIEFEYVPAWLFNDEQVETNMHEAWDHESSKDEMNIVLQGLEQHFWKGTEAGWMGCYDFPGETWAGDGSANKGVMGAGSVCFQQPGRNLVD
jgi:hypothetical protein